MSAHVCKHPVPMPPRGKRGQLQRVADARWCPECGAIGGAVWYRPRSAGRPVEASDIEIQNRTPYRLSLRVQDSTTLVVEESRAGSALEAAEIEAAEELRQALDGQHFRLTIRDPAWPTVSSYFVPTGPQAWDCRVPDERARDAANALHDILDPRGRAEAMTQPEVGAEGTVGSPTGAGDPPDDGATSPKQKPDPFSLFVGLIGGYFLNRVSTSSARAGESSTAGADDAPNEAHEASSNSADPGGPASSSGVPPHLSNPKTGADNGHEEEDHEEEDHEEDHEEEDREEGHEEGHEEGPNHGGGRAGPAGSQGHHHEPQRDRSLRRQPPGRDREPRQAAPPSGGGSHLAAELDGYRHDLMALEAFVDLWVDGGLDPDGFVDLVVGTVCQSRDRRNGQ